MAPMTQDFIIDAQAYCAERGIKLSTLGKYAVGDGSLFARLMAGRRCFPDTLDRVREYMRKNPPTSSGGASA